jgi:chorismate dehydratase
MYTVGSVSYTNARPLVHSLSERIKVELGVPSALPELLEDGSVQAILVSSYYALSCPGRTFAEGCSISSLGAAESVKILSKVAFKNIQTLAFDESSMTSNQLARIILAESYGVTPELDSAAPDVDKMLKTHDACVIIGDKGMVADGDGLDVIDLGQAWRDLTGLPFVWALWVGGDALSPELVGLLNEAREWGQQHLETVMEDAARRCGWKKEAVQRYLGQTMDYGLTEDHLKGLAAFREKLIQNGFMSDIPMPRMVNAPDKVAQ